MLAGCGALAKDATKTTLDKEIERQLASYKLRDEQQPQEQLSREAYEQLGDQQIKAGDINRAYLNYMKALNLEPENISLLHKQGALLLKKRKYPDAEAVYRKLLVLSANDWQASEGLGISLFGQHMFKEAEQSFQVALQGNQNIATSHHYLGLAYSAQGQYDQAIAQFEHALELGQNDKAVLNNLALTYSLMGNNEQAESLLRPLASASKDKKTYNNLAVVLVKLGKFDDALHAFKNGSGTEAVAYYNLGVQFLKLKRYPQAIASFEKAISLSPKYYLAAAQNLEFAKKAQSSDQSH